MEASFWSKQESYITNATGFMKLVFELIEDLDANTMAKVTMIPWPYGSEETKDAGMTSCQSAFDVNSYYWCLYQNVCTPIYYTHLFYSYIYHFNRINK
jgi:hypothetical protein